MDFKFNIYALTLILSGSITLLLSYYVFKKDGGAVKLFGIMMFSNALWSIAYGLELASSNLSQIKLLIDIEYLGITSLPVIWFLFCLHLSGKECWYKKPANMTFLIGVSVLTIVTVWTNAYHHLFYKSLTIDYSSYFPMAKIVAGFGYYLFAAYFYVLLGIGNYLLYVKFRKADPIYRRQNHLIIIASLIPWLANFSYLLGLKPLGNLDITPFAFVATILLIVLAIYKFRLFDILPVAREKVMDLIQDGFIILDNKNRVIDHNLAFKKYLSSGKSYNIIGSTVEEVLPGQDELYACIAAHKSGKIELKVQTQSGLYDLEADIGYLDESKLNSEAIIIKMQDLTMVRRDSLKFQQQTEELQRLNQMKDRIFSIIAHDLRAPLVNLSEVLKMISHDLITTEEFKELTPSLNRDIIYTTDLLENILHWSRSQLKGYGLNREFFDLKGLIVNEVNYHLPSAEAKKISIIQDVFPGAMVYADMLMIQIVIRNIINNAIKFCYDGCEIKLFAVYSKQHTIKLCIEDNGVGMSPATLEKLFNGESHSSRGTMNEKGTGLGLVVCKDFMERNNGTLSVTSELGEGAKFCLHLPVDSN